MKCGIYFIKSQNNHTNEKQIKNNKKFKPKQMNEEIKKLIRETKIAYQIQKTNSAAEI